MAKIIVLIGRTGQGKSALANVLSGENRRVWRLRNTGEKLQEKWEFIESSENELKESESSKSETREIQMVEFEHKGETYQIVDSIGIGDTQLTDSQVLAEIAKGYNIIKNGIHHALFVNGERFTPEEVQTYNLLKNFFFNQDVDKYTTIVRTKFPSFKDKGKCERDVELLLAENNSNITNMINSCNGIIHVDNPSTNITEEDDEELAVMRNDINKKIRNRSRAKLLEHLENWNKNEVCIPKTSKELKKEIRGNEELKTEDFQEFLTYIEQGTKSGVRCVIL